MTAAEGFAESVQDVIRITDQAAEQQYQPLEKYGRDITKLAREGKLDPVIGRDDEIRRVIQVLSRRTKNNPVLIGEAGVGKTAIVEGLAQRIVTELRGALDSIARVGAVPLAANDQGGLIALADIASIRKDWADPPEQIALHNGERSVLDTIPDDDGNDPSKQVQTEVLHEVLERWLLRLSRKQRAVVERRFGLHGYRRSTLEQIGAEIGVTRERVRQIQNKALEKIRDVLEETIHEHDGVAEEPGHTPSPN